MILDGLQKVCSETAKGKFSYSNGFGRLQFSYNRFGLSTDFAGIYCKYKKGNKIHTLRKKFYTPTNPKSQKQRCYRNLFNEAWAYWNIASDFQKDYWRKRGREHGMTGQNYLLKLWMNANKNRCS